MRAVKQYQLIREGDKIAVCISGGKDSMLMAKLTLIRRLKRDNPLIEKSIFNSIHSVNIETFPGYKRAGIVHSYLEEYDVGK